jgi:hypothetical protein
MERLVFKGIALIDGRTWRLIGRRTRARALLRTRERLRALKGWKIMRVVRFLASVKRSGLLLLRTAGHGDSRK